MNTQNLNVTEPQISSIQKYQDLFDLNEAHFVQSQLLFSRLQESSALMTVFDTTVNKINKNQILNILKE